MIQEKEARLLTAGIEAAVAKLNGLMENAVGKGLRLDTGSFNKPLAEGRRFYTPFFAVDVSLPLNKKYSDPPAPDAPKPPATE